MRLRLHLMNRRSVSRIASVAVGLTALWLIAFHLALFWQRMVDATILDPAVLLRWAGSALLIGAAVLLRRYADRHLTRRHATFVFWLVVLLLHVTVPAEEKMMSNVDVLALALETGIIAAPLFLVSATLGSNSIPLRQMALVAGSSAGRALPLLASNSASRAPPAN